MSKTGQIIESLRKIFTKITISVTPLTEPYYKIILKLQLHEDKSISKLKPLAPHSLNTEINDCAKEIYHFM